MPKTTVAIPGGVAIPYAEELYAAPARRVRFGRSQLLISAVALGLASCATAPSAPASSMEQIKSEAKAAAAEVQPVGSVLSLQEALARGIKYNLDIRVKMLEQTLANRQVKSARSEILPKVLASAGYDTRDSDYVTRATDYVTGAPSLANPYVSSDRSVTKQAVSINWSLLDFAGGLYGASEARSRQDLAQQHYRKAVQLLMLDIEVAYYRAAAAEKLHNKVLRTLAEAEKALRDAETVEASRIRNPLEAARYQKAVLENARLLRTIDQELSTARQELASLIRAPASSSWKLGEVQPEAGPAGWTKLSDEALDEIALVGNADLREANINAQLAAKDARRELLKFMPTFSLQGGPTATSNSYAINAHWLEGSAAIGYNLINLALTRGGFSDAKVRQDVASAKRLALQTAVIAQIRLARAQYDNAVEQLVLAQRVRAVDGRIEKLTLDRRDVGGMSQLDAVAASTNAILSELRAYQAAAQVTAANGRMWVTLGAEKDLPTGAAASLPDLQAAIVETLKLRMTAPVVRAERTSPAKPVKPAPIARPASAAPRSPVTGKTPPATSAPAGPKPAKRPAKDAPRSRQNPSPTVAGDVQVPEVISAGRRGAELSSGLSTPIAVSAERI